ncbi:DUF2723 domain-containing protein [candidate division KSB1 bacterium]|nr:DUF2723 domain-containing protein [candidate division KSB1 bacterium]
MLTEKNINRIIAFVVFLASTFVYLRTIAPTTSFWDCGEFIACSYILGVPHPPGAPFYLLLGRIFSMIPFASDIGLRVNVISALTTGLTIMLLYLIIIRLITIFRGSAQTLNEKIVLYASGVLGAMFFAFSDTVWFNAVEAEVYAISLFFTAIVVWLILVWFEKADDPHSDRYIFMIAYCIGLAIGVHLLNVLAIPAIAFIYYFRKIKFRAETFILFSIGLVLSVLAIYPGIVKYLPKVALNFLGGWFFVLLVLILVFGVYWSIKAKHKVAHLIITSFLLIIIAASTYTLIYIRSNLNPAIDENDPETLEQMVSYLNREQYGDWSYFERRAPLWEYQIKKMYLRYFGWQFIGTGTTLGEDRRVVENFSLNGLYGLPFLVGLIGMFYHFKKDWKHASSIMLLFIATGLAIVLYLNQEDPQPRERDYVFVGSFFAFAIWIGIGAHGILNWIKNFFKENDFIQRLGVYLGIIVLAVALPVRAFTLHYESHDRTGNYVAYDYSYNILESCEPNAILFTNGDNDTFPLWFLQYVYNIRTDVRVVNLSLLNTNWYIKQLKYDEPRVPISLPDKTIDQLGPQLLPEEGRRTVRIPVPREAYITDYGDGLKTQTLDVEIDEVPEMVFELKPTFLNKAVRVQDLMILDIIRTNKFRRPIYFALTVSRENQLNLFKYLRMDGLVFKLVTYPEQRISAKNLRENLMNRYLYRGLNDESVFLNENIKGLLRNYQGAFFSLGQHYAIEKNNDELIATFDKLFEVMPDSLIPMRNDLKYNIGYLYHQAGRQDKFQEIIDRIIESGETSNDEKLTMASIYVQLFDNKDRAESIVKSVLASDPGFIQAFQWLVNFYANYGFYDKGVELISDWLIRNPNDQNAKKHLNTLRELAKSQSENEISTLDTTQGK